MTERAGAAFQAAYRLDVNAIPAEYTLLRPEGPARADEELLLQALARAAVAAGLSDDERLPFEGSTIHHEIARGLLGTPPDAAHDTGVLCAIRSFAGDEVGPAVARFAAQDPERGVTVRQLTEAVLARLPAENVWHYEIRWDGERGPAFDEDVVAEVYLSLLRPKLEAVMAARTAVRTALAAEGRDDAVLANAAFAAQRAEHFVGREDELVRVATYLADETTLPLVVTGAAGSGKSTLLAEAAKLAAVIQPGAVLVTRYLGVSPGTGSLVELLNDLRRTIALAYDQVEPLPLTDSEELISVVATEFAMLRVPPERPLLLIVDALDQLGAFTQRTDWLPPRLASHVRVVVSLLADRPELAVLRARLPGEQVLTLQPLSLAAGRAMLSAVLKAAPSRTLTVTQEGVVLDAFAAQGLPLYLRLAASEARRWRSFGPPGGGRTTLPETTPDFLHAILDRLERPTGLGSVLVSHALGDLAAARFGLAEDEMLDLLARDADVRQQVHNLSPHAPQITPDLPFAAAPWARLAAEIEPVLTEREFDGVRLFTLHHQQLRAAIEARYLAGTARMERHQALAAYFAAQPWILGPGQWNWRKVRELLPQQEGAGDQAGAEQTLQGLADVLEAAPSTSLDLAGVNALVAVLVERIFTSGHWWEGQRLILQQLAVQRNVGDRAGEGTTLRNLEQFAGSSGRHGLCRDLAYACLFDRPKRTLGASGG